ncbi:hypothetical protein HMN09_00456300 [Mycena chlorophos]|uniref:F-box domain-containing protein n=1 Tax=Mycena chlorophos TaxID=658473 RepID=A0A8H6TGE2_MYCCL|nr:hypothetical protein HMN09_00456300 [Mycena chlorophos]
MDSIPPETLYMVASHVPLHDKQPLQACSLVSCRFQEPFQRRLHQHILLETAATIASTAPSPLQAGTISYLQAAHHLDVFPHLAAYVQNCGLSLSFADGTADELDATISVLNRLVNVRDAMLSKSVWFTLREDVQAALLRFMDQVVLHRRHRLGLRVFHTFPVATFLRLLRSSRNLRVHAVHLQMSDLEDNTHPLSLGSGGEPEGCLDSESMDIANLVRREVLDDPGLWRHLRSLRVQGISDPMNHYNMKTLRTIASHSRTTLQRLAIDFSAASWCSIFKLHPVALHLTLLRQLDLHFENMPEQPTGSWKLPVLVPHLVTMCNAPALEHFQIHLTYRFRRSHTFATGSDYEHLLPGPMSALDGVLHGWISGGLKVNVGVRAYTVGELEGEMLEDCTAARGRGREHFQAVASILRQKLPSSLLAGLDIFQWEVEEAD